MALREGTAVVGEGAFEGQTGLSRIDLPSSVTHIGCNAFKGCEGLTEVALPLSVSRIDDKAFALCTGLSEFHLASDIKWLGSRVFAGCDGLRRMAIEAPGLNYGYRSFEGCDGIEEFYIDTRRVGVLSSYDVEAASDEEPRYDYFLQGREALQRVVIGEHAATIDIAFHDCPNLKEVRLPASIEYVYYPFCNNTALTDIYLEATTPPAVHAGTWLPNDHTVLHVPQGRKALYEAAYYWREFTVVDDLPTSVEHVATDRRSANRTAAYDLQGRRVSEQQRGIVIEGRKEIFRK